MRPHLLVMLIAFLGLAGCAMDGTNPLQPDDEEDVVTPDPGGGGEGIPGDGVDQEGGIEGVDLPPGTDNPRPNNDLRRVEERDDKGGGLARDFRYNAATDTFSVDNLAFDGFNEYRRSGEEGVSETFFAGSTKGGTASSGTLGGYAVYEADIAVTDFLDGSQVGQALPYRAIFGVSEFTAVNDAGETVPRSAFAIVRTGGYTDYGFGGFIYERSGAVVLPPDNFRGQAVFEGEYAGMRVFEGRSGLEFTRGDVTVQLDFLDFNQNDGVAVFVRDREAFDSAGNPIDPDTLPLPVLTSVVRVGVDSPSASGEITGDIGSTRVNETGVAEEYETGKYYGILSGDITSGDGGEIVGIFVVESEDPRFENVNAQETGGFIVYR